MNRHRTITRAFFDLFVCFGGFSFFFFFYKNSRAVTEQNNKDGGISRMFVVSTPDIQIILTKTTEVADVVVVVDVLLDTLTAPFSVFFYGV